MNVGKVYLVGAGPGEPGLMTVRGRECLALADVVIADYLVHPTLLGFAQSTAEILIRPKGRRGPLGAQSEIHDVMLARARAGQTVVRLKGGDPFIFGRGGEEAEALAVAGIPFEVVPGITAATGAAAYAGVPLTHRGVSGVVAFVTGHEADQKDQGEIDWQAVARGATTLVLYMSVQRLPEIAEKLVVAGRSRDEPVVIIENGTLATQRIVRATVATAAAQAARYGVRSPAITIVGPVAALPAALDWFASQPLRGKHVLLLSSKTEISAIDGRGAEIQWLSPFDIVPHIAELRTLLGRLSQFPALAFTSGHAVDALMAAIAASGFDVRVLGGSKLLCVGEATARKLRQFHLEADLITEGGGRELAQAFVASPLAGPVLFLRAAHARADFVDQLQTAQATVEEVVAYEAQPNHERLKQMWRNGKTWDVIALGSPRAVDALFETAPEGLAGRTKFAAIGKTTADALLARGVNNVLTASRPDVKVLLQEIVAMLESTLSRPPVD